MIDVIVQKVIDIIKDGINNMSELDDVKHVYYGRLRTLTIEYPAIVVWLEEELPNDGVKADSSRILYRDVIGISVLDKSVEEDEGEKSVLKKAVKVEELLRANPTLDGLVTDDPLQAIPKRILPVNMRDFALTEVSMLVTYRRWVNA